MRKRLLFTAGACALALTTGSVVAQGAFFDFGVVRDKGLAEASRDLFGFRRPVAASSTLSITEAEALADPTALVTLAGSLRVRAVTADAGAVTDMMALWPDAAAPTHLISCNESGPEDPGLQRIEIATGTVETILTGTDACDPAHLTPWGTIVFAEEAGGGAEGGRLYELLDPLETTGVTLDRTTGVFSGGVGAENFAVRASLGRLSYEGIAIYPSGLVYYGDENRPFEGAPGGAYYKFVPSVLRDPAAGAVSSLDDSPLADGSIYGLRLGLRSDATDYGQGSNTGLGVWVPICAVGACADADLQAHAASLHLTGYYRPEDLSIDRAEEAAGNVRFCGPNTGNEGDNHNWGEVVCITDGSLTGAEDGTSVPELQYLVLGSSDFAMPDNIAYQPARGNWIVHEDGATDVTGNNNDLFACLDDGADADGLSDGCVRAGTLNDLTAEWTGGLFSADGKHFYVSIQHNISGTGVVLDITGWK